MRTLLGKNNTDHIAAYVAHIVDPLWISMQAQPAAGEADQPGAEQRMERACLRLEKAVSRLEKAGR
jgi:hypothetical protein